jgi:RNA polymerase sigma factor (sigma-70 family)
LPQQSNSKQLVSNFFRTEYGQTVAFLSNRFGTAHLELIEDAVQEAMIKALQVWSYHATPDNPKAWIRKTAHNHLIDVFRRRQKVYYAAAVPEKAVLSDDPEQPDDVLRMIFACCHPKLSHEYQLIIVLKLLGGLSISEIAAALNKKKSSIAKSFTRAKAAFKTLNPKLEIPTGQALQERHALVLKVLYLIFSEGYRASDHISLIRKDLCVEAIRLTYLMLADLNVNGDVCRSLLALMLFQFSRFESRIDPAGVPIRLGDQDRSKWNYELINEGNFHLNEVHSPTDDSYFLQAAINGVHANAESLECTDWSMILDLYDRLMKQEHNPFIALNRLIAVGFAMGFDQALLQMESSALIEELSDHYLYHLIKSELHERCHDIDGAIRSLHEAQRRNQNKSEALLMSQRLVNLRP